MERFRVPRSARSERFSRRSRTLPGGPWRTQSRGPGGRRSPAHRVVAAADHLALGAAQPRIAWFWRFLALAARPGARRVEDSLLSCGLRFGERARERSLAEAVDALLAGLPIAALADLPCEGLSFGQERMVEIVRALAIEPRVLLLDEPLSGLNGDEIPPVLELVASARARGIAVLFVEHDLRSLLRAVDRLVVLDHGKKIAQGDPESVCADPTVLEAYIGDELVA